MGDPPLSLESQDTARKNEEKRWGGFAQNPNLHKVGRGGPTTIFRCRRAEVVVLRTNLGDHPRTLPP